MSISYILDSAEPHVLISQGAECDHACKKCVQVSPSEPYACMMHEPQTSTIHVFPLSNRGCNTREDSIWQGPAGVRVEIYVMCFAVVGVLVLFYPRLGHSPLSSRFQAMT